MRLCAEEFAELLPLDQLTNHHRYPPPPHVGDFLVVILIYCTVRTFWKGSSLKVALAVLLFAYAVEFSQYFGLINLLGLQSSRLAMVIMGKSFQWYDMLAYTLGIIVVILFEKVIRKVE